MEDNLCWSSINASALQEIGAAFSSADKIKDKMNKYETISKKLKGDKHESFMKLFFDVKKAHGISNIQNRYIPQCILGTGGTCEIWLCRDRFAQNEIIPSKSWIPRFFLFMANLFNLVKNILNNWIGKVPFFKYKLSREMNIHDFVKYSNSYLTNQDITTNLELDKNYPKFLNKYFSNNDPTYHIRPKAIWPISQLRKENENLSGVSYKAFCNYICDSKILSLSSLRVIKLVSPRNRNIAHLTELKILKDINQSIISDKFTLLHKSFENSRGMFFVMDALLAGDLWAFKNSYHPIPPRPLRYIYFTICKGVRALHDLGYIHQDIKPENFAIDHLGNIKLIDFGMARERGLQRATRCVGTPEYCPPELYRRKPYDIDFDAWSMGITFYELLFGEPPYSRPKKSMNPHHDVAPMVILWKEKISFKSKNIREYIFLQFIAKFIACQSRRCKTEDSIMDPLFIGMCHQTEQNILLKYLPTSDSLLKSFNVALKVNNTSRKKQGWPCSKMTESELLSELRDLD